MAIVGIIALVFIGLLVMLLLWGVGVYNSLVQLKNKMLEAWSGVDVQLKKRYNLIPNLICQSQCSKCRRCGSSAKS